MTLLLMLMLFLGAFAAVGLGGIVWRLGRWMLAEPEGVGGFVVRLALVLALLYTVRGL